MQFYSEEGFLIGDTNILDLDQKVFTKSDIVLEESIDGLNSTESIKEKKIKKNQLTLLKKHF